MSPDGRQRLLAAGVLGDSLGALRHGVLGQLTGQKQADGGLDLPGGDGGALVVVGQTRRLGGDALKNVVHERVHDAHGLGRDAGVRVHLLQHLVDVDGVGLLALLPALLVLADILLGLAGLLGGLSARLGRHDEAASDTIACGRTRDFATSSTPSWALPQATPAPLPTVGATKPGAPRSARQASSTLLIGCSSCLDAAREER